MDREKLARDILASPLNNVMTDLLLRRLKVASCEGCAAVVRDFEEAMHAYRMKALASYRRRMRHATAFSASPHTKQGFTFDGKLADF